MSCAIGVRFKNTAVKVKYIAAIGIGGVKYRPQMRAGQSGFRPHCGKKQDCTNSNQFAPRVIQFRPRSCYFFRVRIFLRRLA